jgi:uncharacterized membrane protein
MKSLKGLSKKEFVSHLKGRLEVLEEEIKNDISVPVISSFGFIIALVWRDAIKGAIDEFLIRKGLVETAYVYNFISAIFVTLIVIFIMIVILRFSRRSKQKKLKRLERKLS